MTVGADTEAVTTTLTTISLIRDELGVNMCLGASNVSFGLPQRHVLNAAFLPMAMAAGLTSAIMSTAEVCVESVRAADLLLGHDPWGASWIAAHRARQAATATRPPQEAATRRERCGAQPASGRARRGRGARRRRPARPAALPARRHRGPRPQRDADLRRRELERDRDRLDLRRPRHLQEVQGPDRLGRGAGRDASTRARSPPTSCATAGGWPAAPAPAATWSSRCRRCRRGPRRRWSASGAT